MKRTLAPISIFICAAGMSPAALTIEIQFGQLLDSSGSALVPESSIWALIYDANNDGIFPGALLPDTSLTDTNSLAAFADFSGATIQAGQSIGSDLILSVFEVDGENTSGLPGLSIQTIVLNDAEWQAVGGLQWGLYWFPGLTQAAPTLPGGNFEIGGMRVTAANSGGDIGMTFPNFVENSALDLTASFLDDTVDVGGDIPASRFEAIVAVPEPTSLSLAALGLAGLLVRRRK